jgi:hypothetical protein
MIMKGQADASLRNGNGDNSGFNGPLGLALSPSTSSSSTTDTINSVLYVADRYNNAVRAIILPHDIN